MAKLEDLFYIAHANALNLIKIKDDKLFLESQRKKGRPGFMFGIDHELTAREERIEKRQQNFRERKEKSNRENVTMNESLQISPCTSESDINEVNLNLESTSDEIEMPTPAKKMRGCHNIITQKIAACLDACKISDRKAVHIIIAVVEAMGQDVQNYIINRTSIHNARTKFRAEQFMQIKQRFNNSELNAMCLHWDGKLLPSLTGSDKVDRLPILISSGRSEQLLEIPALKRGTGREQASAVCKAVYEWGLQEHIKALVFDTTAVNTGRFNGTCTIIENSLQRQLLWLPCRHHILEIVLRSVFEEKMTKTEGPNVKIFETFKASWNEINAKNFRSGMEDKVVRQHLGESADKIIQFANTTLKIKQPRDDYKEFLELVLVFLGETSNHGSQNFRAPGAVHHARWMAKAIYCLKIFIFRQEFKLAVPIKNAIRKICMFIVAIYVEMWFTTPLAAQAPYNDFKFLKKLDSFKVIDDGIAKVALQKFRHHLWYLSPECMAFAFFDQNLPVEIKAQMVDALARVTNGDEGSKRVSMEEQDISKVMEAGMEQFVTSETNQFFKRFNIDTSFLTLDPDSWLENNSFQNALQIVNDLKVVNDAAERGVKLMQDYNSILTKNEVQMQYILQVVKKYQQQFPVCTKEVLSKNV